MSEPGKSPKASSRLSPTRLLGSAAIPTGSVAAGVHAGLPPDAPEPLYGLEVLRRSLGLSKAAFYGPGGPYHSLPIVTLSERRRGVRKSDYEAWLGVRTRRPSAP